MSAVLLTVHDKNTDETTRIVLMCEMHAPRVFAALIAHPNFDNVKDDYIENSDVPERDDQEKERAMNILNELFGDH